MVQHDRQHNANRAAGAGQKQPAPAAQVAGARWRGTTLAQREALELVAAPLHRQSFPPQFVRQQGAMRQVPVHSRAGTHRPSGPEPLGAPPVLCQGHVAHEPSWPWGAPRALASCRAARPAGVGGSAMRSFLPGCPDCGRASAGRRGRRCGGVGRQWPRSRQ